jgi:hypothetical protein
MNIEQIIAEMKEDVKAEDKLSFNRHYLTYKLARVEYRLMMMTDGVSDWQVCDYLDKKYQEIKPLLEKMK